tara:strand:+ start:258 stop:434 length:177 start_codon:yes stop_codon:yes gene_type:complete
MPILPILWELYRDSRRKSFRRSRKETHRVFEVGKKELPASRERAMKYRLTRRRGHLVM